MYRFHACVHVRPRELIAGPLVEIEGRPVATLSLSPASLDLPFGVTFEEAAAALSALPRLFIEPDGSFVWVAAHDEPAWQVEGCLYDRAGRLLYLELKGSCPKTAFDRLLGATGWPDTRLVFQLVRQAVFVEENEFRRAALA